MILISLLLARAVSPRKLHQDKCKSRMDPSVRWDDEQKQGKARQGKARKQGSKEARKEHAMFRERIPCVYILANGPRGTLYIGVTSDLPGRVWQHKHDQVEGFTSRYQVHTLVWYEVHDTMESAIVREKSLKSWKRQWKIELVENANPEWCDLHPDIL